MVWYAAHIWDVSGADFSHTAQNALVNVLKKRKQIGDTISPGNKSADMAASGGMNESSRELYLLKWMEQKGTCAISFGEK